MPERQDLRIVFAGTPDFAAAHLRALLADGCRVVGVYTQPDRPAGRGKRLMPSPVKTVASDHDIPVFQPVNFRQAPDRDALAALAPDVMVVVAYGLILPESVLTIPKKGCINVHASLLPRWRGAAPIQRAIEAGDDVTGVTLMQMDTGLDTGAMLDTITCTIEPGETGGSLHDKLAQAGPVALLETLTLLASGKLAPRPQDDSRATYATKITKAEALLDWTRPAVELERKIRAFNPFPVAFARLDGLTVRLWQSRVRAEDSGRAPGTIVKADDGGIDVACGEGTLRLVEMQLPGKKRLAVADILRGRREQFRPGQIFES